MKKKSIGSNVFNTMLFLCLVVFCLFYPDEMLWGFLKSDEGVFLKNI